MKLKGISSKAWNTWNDDDQLNKEDCGRPRMSAIDMLKSNIGKAGERKYLISSKWWQ